MNILSLLKEDHKKIKSLLKDLKTSRKKEYQLTALHELVHAHAKAEEMTLYEPLKDKKEGRTLALEGYEEHQVVATLLKELDSLSSGDERWKAKLTVLEEALHHHIEEEESEIFSAAKETFSPPELMEAGKRFLLQKSRFSDDLSPRRRGAVTLSPEKRRAG